MRGSSTVLVLIVVMLVFAGCRHDPVVVVEQLYSGAKPDPTARARVFPPRCAEIPPARYPTGIPPDRRPERVDVRVDLVIDEYGRARNAKGTVLNDVSDAAPFVDAAEIASYLMSCEPAMRTPRPDSDETAPVPIDYRSAVVFRFYRDERRVEVDQ